MTLEQQPTTTAPPSPAGGKTPTWRRILTWVLVTLACLLVAITVVATWSHFVLLDTDRFVSVVEPIVHEPAVVDAVSNGAAEQIVAALDIRGRTQAALPERAGFIGVTAEAGAERFIQRQLDDLLSREGVQEAWLAALRFAHDRLLAILRDEGRFVAVEDGTISLNLFPLIEAVLRRLADTRLLPDGFVVPELTGVPPDEARQQLSTALGRPLPADFGTIPVAESEQVEQAQQIVSTYDTLVAVLPVVALLLTAGAIFASTNRRKTLIVLGIAIAATLILAGLIVRLSGKQVVDAVRDRPAAYAVAQTAVDSLTEDLWKSLLPGIVIALAVAAGAYLWGRRDWLASARGDTGDGARMGALRGWVAAHADALRLAGVALAVVLLLIVNLTWGILALTLVLLGAYLLALALIAGKSDRPAADSGTPATTAL